MNKNKKDAKNKVKSYIKTASSIVIGYGVGEFMGTVMKDFKPNARGIRKLFIKVGALALTGMVIKSVTDYIDQEIDDVFDTIEEITVEVIKDGEDTDVVDN